MKKYPGVGVGVMLQRDGKILLGKRHDDPEKADSLLHGEGTWTFPGGKLDFQESLFDAAKRETKEETSIVPKGMEIFSIGNERVHDAHFITIGFLCKEFEGEAKVMEPDEITKWEWFGFDELPEKIFPPVTKMIKNYLDKEVYKH